MKKYTEYLSSTVLWYWYWFGIGIGKKEFDMAAVIMFVEGTVNVENIGDDLRSLVQVLIGNAMAIDTHLSVDEALVNKLMVHFDEKNIEGFLCLQCHEFEELVFGEQDPQDAPNGFICFYK